MEIKQRMGKYRNNQQTKVGSKEINKLTKFQRTEKTRQIQITKIKNERGDTNFSLTEITKYYKSILCTNVPTYYIIQMKWTNSKKMLLKN